MTTTTPLTTGDDEGVRTHLVDAATHLNALRPLVDGPAAHHVYEVAVHVRAAIDATEENDMAKKKAADLVRFGAYLRADQVEALQRIQEREGVSVAYMIRSGVDRELEARGERQGGRHGR